MALEAILYNEENSTNCQTYMRSLYLYDLWFKLSSWNVPFDQLAVILGTSLVSLSLIREREINIVDKKGSNYSR